MLSGGFNLRLVPSFPPEDEAPTAAVAATAITMPGSTEASPAAAVVPCRRDMKRRLQEELDAVRGLLSKAEALVAVAREDVNGGAAASAPAKRSLRRVRSPPRRGRSEREELDRVRVRHGGRSRREEFDRARDHCRGRSDREELDRERDRRRRRRSHLEELDRERDRRRRSDREEFDRARKTRRLSETESEPRKIAPAVDASPSLCEIEEGEIAEDHGAAMDIDIRGGVSPLVMDKAQSSPLAKKDDDELLVDISGEASPVAIENFPEATKSSISPSSNSCSDEPSLGNYSGTGDDDDDDGGGESSMPDTTCLPTEAAATVTTPLAAENALTERAAAPANQTSQLIAIAKEKQRLRRELERRRAREALEALARAARPIHDDIDAMDMMQLGLFEVQYIVSTEKAQDGLRGGGGLLQQLGFFLKPEYS
uniref:Uncharacterized protein n=1 Tax=Oryza punctata TaxID=4537 RepID=A0A0E0L4L4_ORYPU